MNRWKQVVCQLGATTLPLLLVACNTSARLQPPIETAPANTNIAGNRAPTVSAAADPTTIAPGGQVTLSAEVYDPDGDRLTIKWSAPSGTFNNPAGARTYWTAPDKAGAVTITITVDDGRGEKTQATVMVTVK
jgi:hypothetical protein